MSADNITRCPRCEEFSLREYDTHCTISTPDHQGKTWFLIPAYQAECRNCGWKWSTVPREEEIDVRA